MLKITKILSTAFEHWNQYLMHIKITKSPILQPVNRNEYQNMDKNYCKLSTKMWYNIIQYIQTNNSIIFRKLKIKVSI